MKVLTINGPPHAKGNTAIAINEMIRLSNEQAGYDAGKKKKGITGYLLGVVTHKAKLARYKISEIGRLGNGET